MAVVYEEKIFKYFYIATSEVFIDKIENPFK